MSISIEQKEHVLALIGKKYPEWDGFGFRDFVREELGFKRSMIMKASSLLGEDTLAQLLVTRDTETFISRLEHLGNATHLLNHESKGAGDLAILYVPNLDKSVFCAQIYHLLHGTESMTERFSAYLRYVEENQLPNTWAFPTYLLQFTNPKMEIFIEPRSTEWFLKFIGLSPYLGKPSAETYSAIKSFALNLKRVLAEFKPRDLVDIQAVIRVCGEMQHHIVDDITDEDTLDRREPYHPLPDSGSGSGTSFGGVIPPVESTVQTIELEPRTDEDDPDATILFRVDKSVEKPLPPIAATPEPEVAPEPEVDQGNNGISDLTGDVAMPAEEQSLQALYHEFQSTFFRSSRGESQIAFYKKAREQAEQHFALLVAEHELGEQVSDRIFLHLLPHPDLAEYKSRGAWLHPSPAVTDTFLHLYEDQQGARAEELQPLAEAILDLIRRCVYAPDEFEQAINEFIRSPFAEEIDSRYLSPILNALKPSAYLLTNTSSLQVVRSLTNINLGLQLGHYPELNQASSQVMEHMKATIPFFSKDEVHQTELFDMFCDWLVQTKEESFKEIAKIEIEEVSASENEAAVEPPTQHVEPTSLVVDPGESIDLEVSSSNDPDSQKGIDEWRFFGEDSATDAIDSDLESQDDASLVGKDGSTHDPLDGPGHQTIPVLNTGKQPPPPENETDDQVVNEVKELLESAGLEVSDSDPDVFHDQEQQSVQEPPTSLHETGQEPAEIVTAAPEEADPLPSDEADVEAPLEVSENGAVHEVTEHLEDEKTGVSEAETEAAFSPDAIVDNEVTDETHDASYEVTEPLPDVIPEADTEFDAVDLVEEEVVKSDEMETVEPIQEETVEPVQAEVVDPIEEEVTEPIQPLLEVDEAHPAFQEEPQPEEEIIPDLPDSALETTVILESAPDEIEEPVETPVPADELNFGELDIVEEEPLAEPVELQETETWPPEDQQTPEEDDVENVETVMESMLEPEDESDASTVVAEEFMNESVENAFPDEDDIPEDVASLASGLASLAGSRYLAEERSSRRENKDLSRRTQDSPFVPIADKTGFSEEELKQWVATIQRKKQAVLFGPPGTGKTYLAEALAYHLVGNSDGFVETLQFHPGYTYELFMGRPQRYSDALGRMETHMKPGHFLRFCRKAEKRDGLCVMVIDDINRAHLQEVFGELVYLLENRGKSLTLVDDAVGSVPENVVIIGTMSPSEARYDGLDPVMRRRFAIISLNPNYGVVEAFHRRTGLPVEGLIGILEEINEKLGNSRNALGITYFLRNDLEEHISDIWRTEVEPHLVAHFSADPQKASRYAWSEVKDRIMQGWF